MKWDHLQSNHSMDTTRPTAERGNDMNSEDLSLITLATVANGAAYTPMAVQAPMYPMVTSGDVAT